MPADDAIKPAVVSALIKEGWTITHDPLTLDYEEVSVAIDLGGERLLAAERGLEQIAIEVKTLFGASPVREYRDTLGQYELYQMILEDLAPDRRLYIAMSEVSYQRLLNMRAFQRLFAKRPLPLIIVRLTSEEIVQWIVPK